MNISQAPIKEIIADEKGLLSPTWIDWFTSIGRMHGVKRNQQNVTWTPVFNNDIFSVSGTITGTYTQVDNIVFFNIVISSTGGGNSSTVLNVDWVNNLPARVQGTWFAQVFDENKADIGRAYLKDGTKELYVPSWSTVSGQIMITGNYITDE